MNDASRKRANITGTIFGVLFGIANLLPGFIGSVPGCGCCLNYFVWLAALLIGAFAGLFAAVFADWVKTPYDHGLASGGMLGLRAGALAGLFGGLVFQAVPTCTQMFVFMFPGANEVSAQQAESGAMGAVMATLVGSFVNLAVVPLCSGLCGAFWGFVVGAIRRRQDGVADAAPQARGRIGYFALAYGACWAIMIVLTIGYAIIVATRPGGGIAQPTAEERPPIRDTTAPTDEAPDEELGAPADDLGLVPPGSGAPPTEVWLDAPCAPLAVTASRALDTGHRGESYPASYAFDGSDDTAWAVRDPLPGQDWIEATLPPGTRVSRVSLTTGYEKHSERAGDLFVLNAHLSRFTLETDAGRTSVDVDQAQRSADVRLNAETSRVRLVVEGVWPGERWQDLSISEIVVYCAR